MIVCGLPPTITVICTPTYAPSYENSVDTVFISVGGLFLYFWPSEVLTPPLPRYP